MLFDLVIAAKQGKFVTKLKRWYSTFSGLEVQRSVRTMRIRPTDTLASVGQWVFVSFLASVVLGATPAAAASPVSFYIEGVAVRTEDGSWGARFVGIEIDAEGNDWFQGDTADGVERFQGDVADGNDWFMARGRVAIEAGTMEVEVSEDVTDSIDISGARALVWIVRTIDAAGNVELRGGLGQMVLR